MSLELRFGETTRGSGKIYIHVSVEGADGSVPPADLAFESRNLTAGGAFLPSSTMAVPGIDGVVAIIPVLSVAQQLTVIARYADGREAARAVKTIRPLLATAESRFNTVVKNSTALAIRGCDLRYTGNPVSILVDETVFGRPGFNNVLGTITLLGCTREEVEGEVSLRIIGGNGMKADEGEWIRMGDSISRRSAVPEIFERSISFSFEIPLSCTRYLMWVTGPGVEAFQCIEPHHLAEDRKKRAEFTLPADLDQSYEEWYLRMHRATETELRAQRAHRFDYEPVFSIVVPVFRTPIPFFREMAASVLDQTYPHLELILVNASPDDVVLAQEVEALAGSDARVKHVMLDENQGIWGNTALGIEQATGDFIAFLDHDDVLEPDALFCYAKGLNENPEIDLLYSDEDKLKDGHYLSPFFKPDWSPDYLMSQNYVCHMLCVRKGIIDELPEMGTLYDGAQDHFVTLFAGERARAVYHAQRVLYHWRIHEQSTAAQAGAKSYTTEAGVRAIQAHLDRMGVDATAEATPQIAPNMYRVEYHVPAETQPWVTILIPNKDMAPMLENCIELIRERSTYTNYEIVVIENNSTDPATFELYRRLEESGSARIVACEMGGVFNFSKLINFGVEQCMSEYVLLLNNDIEITTPDWIEKMVGPCRREDVGIVGCKLLYPNGLLQHAAVEMNKGLPKHLGLRLPGDTLHYYGIMQVARDVSAVTGACMLIKRSVFYEAGGFDEKFAIDFNDIDFCLKVRELGYWIVYEPAVTHIHHESISRGHHAFGAQLSQWGNEQGMIFQSMAGLYGYGDPFMNPNLADSAYMQLDWSIQEKK